MKDIFLLVADKSMEFTIKGILSRPQALGIRTVSFDVAVHPNRDGGIRATGAQILALKASAYHHGLLMMDFEGSGSSFASAIEQEDQLGGLLHASWMDRAKAIVIAPELDIWAWGADQVIAREIGWNNDLTIRDWLSLKGFRFDDYGKPNAPKEAIEEALHAVGLARSASIYMNLAKALSLNRCVDPAFIRLRRQLKMWFSAD